MKILIVDDSEICLDVTRMHLEAHGYDVICRKSPIGTGAEILRHRPDVVLVDISMPVLSGPELVALLRRQASVANSKILLFSDRPEDELAQQSKNSGADGYMSKGASPEHWVRVIESMRKPTPKATSGDWLQRFEEARQYKSVQSNSAPYALIVDDDEFLLKALERSLKGRLRVRCLSSSEEALAVLRSGHPPAVVISDVTMPNMDGGQLYARASAGNSTLKSRFVFMTGDALAARLHSDLTESEIPVVMKPISGDQICALVRQIAGEECAA